MLREQIYAQAAAVLSERRRNAQAERKLSKACRVADDSHVVSPRIDRVHLESDLASAGKLALH